MEDHSTPKQRLPRNAAKARTLPERLRTQVVSYLNEEARFLAAVEKGYAAAQRGELVDEQEMDACLEAMRKA
jgi:predicted transcriptional regulator